MKNLIKNELMELWVPCESAIQESTEEKFDKVLNNILKIVSEKKKFILGQEVKDKITGFKGIVTGHADYLTGCNQYCVLPSKLKDNNIIEGRWFDEGRLKLVSKKINFTTEDVMDDEPGCDSPQPETK